MGRTRGGVEGCPLTLPAPPWEDRRRRMPTRTRETTPGGGMRRRRAATRPGGFLRLLGGDGAVEGALDDGLPLARRVGVFLHEDLARGERTISWKPTTTRSAGTRRPARGDVEVREGLAVGVPRARPHAKVVRGGVAVDRLLEKGGADVPVVMRSAQSRVSGCTSSSNRSGASGRTERRSRSEACWRRWRSPPIRRC